MSDAASSSGRRGTARLLVHIDLLGRLGLDEPIPASERLVQEIGHELAHTLVFALASPPRRPFEVAAA